jgi:hypothetical protein
MANGLLDLFGSALGTTPPSYLEGLLGSQQTEDLRKRSIGTGLVNALIGYAAMPKNQNLGLGRILAGSAQAGIQGAQGVYDTATKDYMTSQQIAEMKRKQDLARYQQTAIEKAATQYPEYADAIRANPDLLKDIITSKINVEVDYKDAGDKLIPVNKKTGAPMANLQPIVKTQGVDYKDVGDKLVPLDKFTGKPIAELAPISKVLTTSNTIDYDRYAADTKAAGKVPMDFDTWNLRTKKAGAGGITLPPEALGLGKTAQGDVDKALLSSGDRLSQLNQIQMNFRPEYQTIPYKTQSAWVGLKDKFNAAKPEEKANLQNYAAFRQDSVRQLNTYINEITGAAIGQGEEADRIKAGVPNVGSGMFDGDSPAEFEAKLNNTMKTLRLAEARLAYVKRNGLAITNIKIDEMPSLIAKREREIIAANKLDINKNLTHRQQLKQQLATEFGLVY